MWALFILLPIWWIFTAPGRYILWRNYMFPGHGVGAWYSARQSDSTVILVLISTKFWVVYGTISFVLLGLLNIALTAWIAGPDPMVGIPPFWVHFYYNMHPWFFAKLAELFDLHAMIWIINQWHALTGQPIIHGFKPGWHY